MATTPPNQFSQAEVAGALSAYYGVASTDPGLVRLLGIVAPDIQALAANNPNWKAAIPGVIAKYASVAEQYGLGVSNTQKDAQILQRSNQTDANFAGAFSRLQTSLGVGGADLAARAAGHGGERRSSADFNVAFNGGPYNANNLSDAMKSYVGYNSFTARDVIGAANYAYSLGINAHIYAGYFVGSSDTVRSAIQDHIKNGTKLTNDHITNPNDATAILGAIKSGKIKKEDAPPAIQKIIQDMDAKGIKANEADPKAIHQYFKDNPKALEEAKKANAAAVNAKAHLSNQQKEQQMQTVGAKTETPTSKVKLGL
jgi:hypothetical protein